MGAKKPAAGQKWLWKNVVKRLKTPKSDSFEGVKSWESDCRQDVASGETGLTGLSLAGKCLQTQGVYRVGMDDLAGWTDLHEGWRYEAWALQHQVMGAPLREVQPAVVNKVAWHVMQAVCWNELKWARWFGDNVLTQYPTVSAEWWTPASLFALQLFFLWRGKPKEEALEFDVGPYNGIIDAWSKPKALGAAILAICDFHCANARPLGRCEFWQQPFTLIPFEVEMLYRVRAELGLKTPTVSHPLLANPLGRIPETPPLAANPLLESVIKQCRKLKPGVAGLKKVYWRAA